MSKLICIVGAVGCGKSTLSEILAEKYLVQNADKIAAEVIEGKLGELRQHFGDAIFNGEELDKNAFSDVLFGSAEARKFVGNLVNKEVIQIMKDRFKKGIGDYKKSVEAKDEQSSSMDALKREMDAFLMEEDSEGDDLQAESKAHGNFGREKQKTVANSNKTPEEYEAEGFYFAEITSPSKWVFEQFDGAIQVVLEKDVAMARLEKRNHGWSEEKRSSLYDMQLEEIDKAFEEAKYGELGKRVFKVDNGSNFDLLRFQVDNVCRTLQNE